MKTRILTATIAALLAAPNAQAEVSDEQFAALMAELRTLNERVSQLESDNARLAASNAELVQSTEQLSASTEEIRTSNVETVAAVESLSERESASSWTDRVTWKGDFRTRWEHIAQEGSGDRTRVRIRARPALVAEVNDTMKVGFGLATGGDDPVSTNQTLGGGGSSKDVRLDLAYFDWAVWENTNVGAGKFKNPLYKPGGWGLLWDGDWRPEGLELRYDNDAFFANAIGSWLESDSRNDHHFSFLVQGGFRLPIGDALKLTAGAGYYDISTAGKGSFFGDDDEFFGNSFDPVTNTYLFDYQLVEVFAELGFDLLGRGSKLWADYVHNMDPDEDNTGYAMGFDFGSAKKPGQWELGVFYEDLEKDATLGLLSDSDFGGGGTDVKGFGFTGSYVIAQNWVFNGTYFISENRVSTNPRDFDRLMLDLSFKW